MNTFTSKRPQILVADQSKLDRMILSEILSDDFDIIETSYGEETLAQLQSNASSYSLLLLSADLPGLNGFEIVAMMNRYHWIDALPVILILSDPNSEILERAYSFGIMDYILRPFDTAVVKRRVTNAIMAFLRQRRLAGIVTEQIFEKEKSDKLLISVLSQIVEFRNGEGKKHVINISAITNLLLQSLAQKTDRYGLTPSRINLISTASAMHDIGKIMIPENVLNKPDRLTSQEFNLLKKHAEAGSEILEGLAYEQRNSPLIKTAIEICRWHHERFDGNGYPDGLIGDTIPISAQVVAIADVYDALTSERCYKEAYSHEIALEMISNGQCGAFNPILVDCLFEIADLLKKDKSGYSPFSVKNNQEVLVEEQIQEYELSYSEQLISKLEQEKKKFEFLSKDDEQVIFTYSKEPPLFTINKTGADLFGMDEVSIVGLDEDFLNDPTIRSLFLNKLQNTRKDAPDAEFAISLPTLKGPRNFYCLCTTLWNGNAPNYSTVVGKLRQMKGETDLLNPVPYKLNPIGVPAEGKIEKNIILDAYRQAFDAYRIIDPSDGQIKEMTSNFPNLGENDLLDQEFLQHVVRTGKRSGYCYVGSLAYLVVSLLMNEAEKSSVFQGVIQIKYENVLNEKLRRRINDQLYIDPITGTYNKRYLEERVNVVEDGESVVVLDIHGLKHVNETYGHHMGDFTLRKIVSIIHEYLEEEKQLARYDGDKFILHFKGKTLLETFETMRMISDEIESILIDEENKDPLDATFGGIEGPGLFSILIREADRRMNERKYSKEKKYAVPYAGKV